MQAISISTLPTADGARLYRAATGNHTATGKTIGEALDALTLQSGQTEYNGFLLFQNYQPDQFFTAAQQERLQTLMTLQRSAINQGEELPQEQQAELELLIETELLATADRAKTILGVKS
jgi:hypothetical protein